MEVGELLPRLSILTSPKGGGLFLLHFPGGYPRLTLSAILPCEARTFLTGKPFGMIPRGRPAKLHFYYTRRRTKSQASFTGTTSFLICGMLKRITAPTMVITSSGSI